MLGPRHHKNAKKKKKIRVTRHVYTPEIIKIITLSNGFR